MSLQAAAQHLASRGRGPDTQLVHMAPSEVAGLQAIARAHGGSLTLNPETGLPEAGFLKKLLPTLIGAALTATTGIPAWAIGLGVGGIETARTGSLGKGLMAGLGAYGGAGIASGLSGAGAAQAGAELGAANEAVTAAMPDASAMDVRMLREAAPAYQTAMQSAASPMQTGLTGITQPGGFDRFVGAMGGGKDAARYGLAAAAPLLFSGQEQEEYKGSGPNPYNFAFDWERPSGPSYDSREALQLRGNLRPITQMAEGGPVQNMSDRNEALTLVANGGQMFKEGGETKDVAEGMSGASADAFRYLMGQAASSPATQAAQRFTAMAPAVQPVSMAPATQQGAGVLQRAADAGKVTPGFGFDPATGQMSVIGNPTFDAGVASSTIPDTSIYLAHGGIAALARGGYGLGDYSDGGRLLRGPGDGVSDSIPATIADKRPARLADGEFVVPARIVSELGNGSTEAGARKLYAMMDRVQKARGKTVGKGRVAVNSRADKALPA